jgi:hypothetical protein
MSPLFWGSCLLGYLHYRFTYPKFFKEKWNANLVLPEAPSAQWSLLIESHNKLLEVSCHFALCVQQFDKFQQTKRERGRERTCEVIVLFLTCVCWFCKAGNMEH